MTDNTILTLTEGDTSIEVWTLGARLNAVHWQDSPSLVAGSHTVEEALGPKLNHGSVAGPLANRLAGAKAEIEGQTYRFEKNENDRTLLHSGSKSTRDADWQVAERTTSSARLTLEIPHLSDDFPGNRHITALYQVRNDGFDLTFQATTDAPTLMNLALHPYWSLGQTRDDLELQVKADAYLPVDSDKIPTGEVRPVEGPFDLRRMQAPSHEIDHNFCFDGTGKACLQSDSLNLWIETDAPGLQVFTGKAFGIAIEPQHWPDAPHHGHFPSVLLVPGQTYRQSTTYRFSRNA